MLKKHTLFTLSMFLLSNLYTTPVHAINPSRTLNSTIGTAQVLIGCYLATNAVFSGALAFFSGLVTYDYYTNKQDYTASASTKNIHTISIPFAVIFTALTVALGTGSYHCIKSGINNLKN